MSMEKFRALHQVAVSEEWFQQALTQVRQKLKAAREEVQLKKVFEMWLESDVHESGAAVLEEAFSEISKGVLPQTVRLQVDKIMDVGDSAYSQLLEIREAKDRSAQWERTRFGKTASEARRMLKLRLSDGVQDVLGMEYQFIPALSKDIPLGTKIEIKQGALIRQGTILLTPAFCSVLGGKLPAPQPPNHYERLLETYLGIEIAPSAPSSNLPHPPVHPPVQNQPNPYQRTTQLNPAQPPRPATSSSSNHSVAPMSIGGPSNLLANQSNPSSNLISYRSREPVQSTNDEFGEFDEAELQGFVDAFEDDGFDDDVGFDVSAIEQAEQQALKQYSNPPSLPPPSSSSFPNSHAATSMRNNPPLPKPSSSLQQSVSYNPYKPVPPAPSSNNAPSFSSSSLNHNVLPPFSSKSTSLSANNVPTDNDKSSSNAHASLRKPLSESNKAKQQHNNAQRPDKDDDDFEDFEVAPRSRLKPKTLDDDFEDEEDRGEDIEGEVSEDLDEDDYINDSFVVDECEEETDGNGHQESEKELEHMHDDDDDGGVKKGASKNQKLKKDKYGCISVGALLKQPRYGQTLLVRGILGSLTETGLKHVNGRYLLQGYLGAASHAALVTFGQELIEERCQIKAADFSRVKQEALADASKMKTLAKAMHAVEELVAEMRTEGVFAIVLSSHEFTLSSYRPLPNQIIS